MHPQQRNPALIADRAKSGGWKSGEHHERDRERALNVYDEKTLRNQNVVLDVYAVWRWESSNREHQFEDCKARLLCPGAPVPEARELKDFWRFYKSQSKGRLGKSPTVKSLLSKAKAFKAGFRRVAQAELSDADTEEINRWLKKVLPYECGSDVHDIEKPKYNFKPPDLDRLIDRLWTGYDFHYTHERNRIQFHLQLLWFCNSGARRGGLFKAGVPYKDITLILERTAEGKPRFIYKLDQRTVKNNKDPKNNSFGVSGREHSVLRYDSVFLLLNLAIVDGALNPEDLPAMINSGGDGQVEWTESARDLPICRQVDRQGNVHPTRAMTFTVFASIFRGLLLQEGYLEVSASMHMIRRELGKQLDERYTETERSQHVLQADRRVFGQSYVANVSSCDGFAAFRGEKPDHTAVEYFQGISQFRQPGLPTRLPAAQKDELRQLPEITAYDQDITEAPDEERRNRAKRDRQNVLKKVEKTALKEYRQDRLGKLRRERLLKGSRSQAPGDDPNPLNVFIPEKGRLADRMVSASPASSEEKLEAMRDMRSLLTNRLDVFYRPGEVPRNGECPYCNMVLESIERRKRCTHVHRCRRRAVAAELGVLPSKLKFCFFCMDFLESDEWDEDCQNHLSALSKHCGSITYRNTLIRPAFCLLCIQLEHLSPGERMQSWERDADAIRHMEESHSWPWLCHQCKYSCENEEAGYYHLHDVHGYQLQRKRKYGTTTKSSHATTPAVDALGTASPYDMDALPETQDELDDLMSKYINFPPSPPDTGSPSPTIKPPLDRELGSGWSVHTPLGARDALTVSKASLSAKNATPRLSREATPAEAPGVDFRDYSHLPLQTASFCDPQSTAELSVPEKKAKRREPRISWKPEGELFQVGIPQKEVEGKYIDITCDTESLSETQQDLHPLDASSLDPYISNSVMAPAKDLDLAFTARSSLLLLESCPSETSLSGMPAGSSPITESSLDEDQDVGLLGRFNLDPPSTGQAALMSPPPSRSPTATATDMNPTSSEPSSHGPSPRLATPPASLTMSPCAASNAGSMPDQVTPGGKKRRIKIITTSCNRSENTDDVVSPPPQKKCRITLKTRPQIQSGNEHAGDAKAVQDPPQEERRNKQTKVAKPTKTRIILKTGSRRLHKRSRG